MSTLFLDPIKREPKFKKFGTVDIESQNWTEFVCIGIYDERGFEYIGYDDGGIDSMFEYVFESNDETNVYFAHFAGKFDFLFLLDHVVKSKEYEFDKAIPRGSMILTFSVIKNERKIQFWDSSALLQFSLRSLTASFKVESMKGDVDYNFIKHAFDNTDYSKEIEIRREDFIMFYDGKRRYKLPENYKKELVTYELCMDHIEKKKEIIRHKIYDKADLIAYLRNDCVGLHQVITKFYEWPMIKRSGQAFTVASQAMKVFRSYIEKPIKCVDGEEDTFIRNSYFGGRVEIFRPCYKEEKPNLKCYDVNSLYPYVMRNFDYPIGTACRTNKFSTKHMAVYHCTVEVPDMFCPPLPVKHDGKLLFPIGEFTGYWNESELAMAMDVGCKIKKINDGIQFINGGKIFQKFIDELYNIRLKSEGGSVDNILAKLLMNSTYGKFGINTDDKEVITWETYDDKEKDFMEVEIDGEKFMLVSKQVEIHGYRNVAISSRVASNARCVMYPKYIECGEELYYTDTDSIYTTKEFPSSKELGALKEEEATNEAIFLLPKTYITEGKLKMKGFEKKTLNFNFQDFANALQGELYMMKYTVKARPMTFKSAVARKGKILALSDETEKRIRSVYNKRIVIKTPDIRNWTTRPIKI